MSPKKKKTACLIDEDFVPKGNIKRKIIIDGNINLRRSSRVRNRAQLELHGRQIELSEPLETALCTPPCKKIRKPRNKPIKTRENKIIQSQSPPALSKTREAENLENKLRNNKIYNTNKQKTQINKKELCEIDKNNAKTFVAPLCNVIKAKTTQNNKTKPYKITKNNLVPFSPPLCNFKEPQTPIFNPQPRKTEKMNTEPFVASLSNIEKPTTPNNKTKLCKITKNNVRKCSHLFSNYKKPHTPIFNPQPCKTEITDTAPLTESLCNIEKNKTPNNKTEPFKVTDTKDRPFPHLFSNFKEPQTPIYNRQPCKTDKTNTTPFVSPLNNIEDPQSANFNLQPCKIEMISSLACNVDQSKMQEKRPHVTRKTETFAWNRLFNKYSPSKETTMSPIKCTQANLKSTILTDSYLDISTWTINMSEQHFFDNAFLLLSYSKKDHSKMALLLHRGCIGVDMSFFNNLEEVNLLGKGSFGSVYSCTDPKTQLKFAVKHIFGAYKKYADHTSHLLSYMSERNANIRAMDCPFMVRFLYSLQIKTTGDLFLFFEFCVGDLKKFISMITYNDHGRVSHMLYENKINFVPCMHEKLKEFFETSLIYIFELFCALDFLVKCNIIHQDIKPDNILVSSTLHLKIGDFGLAYRTRTIHRNTNMVLASVNSITLIESENYLVRIQGTMDYQDFELQLSHIEMDDPYLLREIFLKKDVYNTPNIVYDEQILEPSFLVDTWAAGVVAVKLLFRGFHLFRSDHTDDDIYPESKSYSDSLFIVSLVGQHEIYKHYIRAGLIKACGKDLEDLMKFITSIFRPRLTRCDSYTKEKEVYRYTKIVKMKYVDIDKVEKIKAFSARNFYRGTIHMHQISDKVAQGFTQNQDLEEKGFQELLKEIEQKRVLESGPFTVVPLEPGVTINFFG